MQYPAPDGDGFNHGEAETDENTGTLVLDATYASQNISFPQNINLLNEAREDLAGISDDFCRRFDHCIPRLHRQNARKDYLDFSKCKKRTSKRSIRRSCSSSCGIWSKDGYQP